jgi:NAD(P)H-dependent FMN reductase
MDLLPQLTGKIVLPLAVGGSLAHVLAIDYAMRSILSSLNARHITGGLFFLDKQLERTEDGGVTIEAGMKDKLELLPQGVAVRMRAAETPAPPASIVTMVSQPDARAGSDRRPIAGPAVQREHSASKAF